MVKLSAKSKGKGKVSSATKPPAKKSKAGATQELGPTGKPKRKPEQPKKVKLRDQKFIPVPKTIFAGSDVESDEDMEDLGEEEGLEFLSGAGSFLKGMDRDAIRRSTKEAKRLHDVAKINEPLSKQSRTKARLPSIDSDGLSDYGMGSDGGFDSDLPTDEEMDMGEASGSGLSSLEENEDEGGDDDDDESDINDLYDESSGDEDEEEGLKRKRSGKTRIENEAEYETAGRSRWVASPPKAEEDSVEVGRLPIKLANGEVQMVQGSTRVALPASKKRMVEVESEDEEVEASEEEDIGSDDGAQATKMAGQKGRFGRMGIAEIVAAAGWKNAERLDAAKEQIAAVGAEVLAGGELVDIAPLLTRLSTFALPTVPSLEDNKHLLPVPASIRGLAFLSQLAVYKDLVPGYRIRQLTAAEEAEKVRDEVKRLREGEKMLVRSYKGYLKMLETEVKRRTPLASLSLRCMADLLSSIPHFNFSENIMGVLVARLGRRSWDQDADLILQTFIGVFRSDVGAVYSQTLVRLIARMIKERKYQVHPNTLGALLHLRLRDELDSMRSGKKRGSKSDGMKIKPKAKSEIRKQWQTKNQKKREKELKEVQKEIAEAEAEVNVEERAQIQTETLKNLFVLYFSILKHPIRSPLLPAALQGISTFAHLINVDFFRDLLAVLRRIISEHHTEETSEDETIVDPVGANYRVRIRLLAIVTAFDLLSGQGEAVNIDLGDFSNALYGLLRELALDTGIEDPPLRSSSLPTPPPRALVLGRTPPKANVQLLTTSDLLFRSLHSVFFSRLTSSAIAPPWRAGAFAKRLVECSLLFPPDTSKQAIDFVRALMAKDSKLEGMLDTEERMFDGVYKPELDDPQLANPFATSFFELETMATQYWDRSVRNEATKLRDGKVA